MYPVLGHFQLQIAVFKIIPEKPFFQHTSEKRKILYYLVMRLLQDIAVDILLKLAADPEYPCIGAFGG